MNGINEMFFDSQNGSAFLRGDLSPVKDVLNGYKEERQSFDDS